MVILLDRTGLLAGTIEFAAKTPPPASEEFLICQLMPALDGSRTP
jgi:hypothetical protein